MSYYEYRVVPAPRTLAKVEGAKEPEARYSRTLELALNSEGREGWEFQRIEAVTTEIRRGFLSRARPETMIVMVFRRWVETIVDPARRDAARSADHAGTAAAVPPRESRSGGFRREGEPLVRPFQGGDRR